MIRTLELTPWTGRWVALASADRVCCDAPTLAELFDTLVTAGLGDVEVMRAPSPDDPVIYGLG